MSERGAHLALLSELKPLLVPMIYIYVLQEMDFKSKGDKVSFSGVATVNFGISGTQLSRIKKKPVPMINKNSQPLHTIPGTG